jgi:hypothetical protein
MPDMMPDRTHDMNEGPHGAHHIAPDVHGRNFYAIDRQFQDLFSLYLEPGLRAAMTPHSALGSSPATDRRSRHDGRRASAVLQPRDHFGRDENWIDYHHYREMEDRLRGLQHARHDHRAGVLGEDPAHPLLKYGITISSCRRVRPMCQSRFGYLNFIIKRYGSDALKKLCSTGC